MKGRIIPSVCGMMALLLALMYAGATQQSSELVNNKDIHLEVVYDNQIDFAYRDEGPRELLLQVNLETVPVDVVFVIDISGSMAARAMYDEAYFSRLQVAKRAVNGHMMGAIHEKSLIKLVTFGPSEDKVDVSEWLSKNDGFRAVENLVTGGKHSRGADAILEAINQILDHKERRSVLVLLTDGIEPVGSGGTHLYDDVIPYATDNTVQINTILISSERSEDLENVAAETKGFYLWIQEKEHIDTLKDEFSGKYPAYVENMVLSVIPLGDTEVKGESKVELETISRGKTETIPFTLYIENPKQNVEQQVATLSISPFEKEFKITVVITSQTFCEYYGTLIMDTYRYHIASASIILVAFLISIKHVWVSHKRARFLLKGDENFSKGENQFSAKNYEEAVSFYEEALSAYIMAKNKEKQDKCGDRMEECKTVLGTWVEKTNELSNILQNIEDKITQLKKRVGYEPPGNIYQWLFAVYPTVKPLFGENTIMENARTHMNERDLSQINSDLMILKGKLKALEELTDIYASKKEAYLNDREALLENLFQSGSMDIQYIRDLCDLDQVDALFYLNFLIDETLEKTADYDRTQYVRLKGGKGPTKIPEEKVVSKPPEKQEYKIEFIQNYLEEDASGIEKIETLRKTIDVSVEEIVSFLNELRKRDSERYYIDWYEKRVAVDYFILRERIHTAFIKGTDVSDSVQSLIHGCEIPEDIKKRIVHDSQNW